MRQVNQPDVLPNRSLKTGEICKSLFGTRFWWAAQHAGRDASVPGLKYRCGATEQLIDELSHPEWT